MQELHTFWVHLLKIGSFLVQSSPPSLHIFTPLLLSSSSSSFSSSLSSLCSPASLVALQLLEDFPPTPASAPVSIPQVQDTMAFEAGGLFDIVDIKLIDGILPHIVGGTLLGPHRKGLAYFLKHG